MAHGTLIGGTTYEVSGGKTLVGGTGYSIDKGETLVDGTGYEIGFGPNYTEKESSVTVVSLSGITNLYIASKYEIVDGKYNLVSASSYRKTTYEGKSVKTYSSSQPTQYVILGSKSGDTMYRFDMTSTKKYICIGYEDEDDTTLDMALCSSSPDDAGTLGSTYAFTKMTITTK